MWGSATGVAVAADGGASAEAVVIVSPPVPVGPQSGSEPSSSPASAPSSPNAPTAVGDAEVLGAQLANTGPAHVGLFAVIGVVLVAGGAGLLHSSKRALVTTSSARH